MFIEQRDESIEHLEKHRLMDQIIIDLITDPHKLVRKLGQKLVDLTHHIFPGVGVPVDCDWRWSCKLLISESSTPAEKACVVEPLVSRLLMKVS